MARDTGPAQICAAGSPPCKEGAEQSLAAMAEIGDHEAYTMMLDKPQTTLRLDRTGTRPSIYVTGLGECSGAGARIQGRKTIVQSVQHGQVGVANEEHWATAVIA